MVAYGCLWGGSLSENPILVSKGGSVDPIDLVSFYKAVS